MGVYIKGVTVEELMKVLICSTEFMPDGFEIVQTHNVGDMVSRSYLLSEYDRQHEGPPGGARKIIEEAPSEEPDIIYCKECINADYSGLGTGRLYCMDLGVIMHSDDYCSRAERRTDE